MNNGSRRVIIDTKRDICLFSAPRDAPLSQGVENWRKDLYMHRTGKDRYSYYFHFTPASGMGKEKILPVSPVMAERFLQERGLTCSPFPENNPVSRLYAWGYGIAEEF